MRKTRGCEMVDEAGVRDSDDADGGWEDPLSPRHASCGRSQDPIAPLTAARACSLVVFIDTRVRGGVSWRSLLGGGRVHGE